jgi:hypothetical protein
MTVVTITKTTTTKTDISWPDGYVGGWSRRKGRGEGGDGMSLTEATFSPSIK